MEHATIFRRFVALIIDAVIIAIPSIFANSVVPVAGGVVVWLFYGPILECSALKATLGKYLMGIQVDDIQGRRITFQSALLRNLVKIFSSALLCLGYLFAFFNKEQQTLHDLAAGTIVVFGRTETPIGQAWLDAVTSIMGTERSAPSNTIAALERLQKLREQGAITDAEFQKEKQKILG